MKKHALVLATLLTTAPLAQADTVGVGFGTGIWSATPSGTAQLGSNGTNFDLAKDTGLKSNNNAYVWAYFNHPIPLLPNIMLESTNVTHSGTKNTSIKFGGTTFNGQTKTELDLSQVDLVAYWGLPIPMVDINFGVALKQLNGELTLSGGGNSEPKTTDINATIPMGYLGAHFTIPTTDLTLSADSKMISFDGSSLSDTRFKARYNITNFGLKLGVEAGYRTQSLKIDGLSVDAQTDIKIDGLFAGVTLVF